MTARLLAALPVAAALLLLFPARPAAHEVPASVTVQAFVRQQGARVHMLVRVPLESMRDIELPLRGPGYLDLGGIRPVLHEAATIWIADYITILENGRPAPRGNVTRARISIPSDLSFRSWDTALAHVHGRPLDATVDLPWQQALLDVEIEYALSSPGANLAIEPALAHLGVRTATVLRFVPERGSERIYTYEGNPGIVRLDPRWHHAAAHFVKLGFVHILGGIDHLLFLLCLVIPFRRFRPLLIVVTSFTVAHSITLIASALGIAPGGLWFPPLIEALIAASIVYMALENIIGARLERRWLLAFGFGLVHGFGFSFALRDALQFAGSHLITSLLAFNIGVELGQVAVLLIAIPALTIAFSRLVTERPGTIVLSALIAHAAWHWMTERGGELRQYRFDIVLDAAFGVSVLYGLMLALLTGGALWGVSVLAQRLRPRLRAGSAAAEPGG